MNVFTEVVKTSDTTEVPIQQNDFFFIKTLILYLLKLIVAKTIDETRLQLLRSTLLHIFFSRNSLSNVTEGTKICSSTFFIFCPFPGGNQQVEMFRSRIAH